MKILRKVKKAVLNKIKTQVAQLAISALPQSYREEFEYFETIRNCTSADQKYYLADLRKKTHILEKAVISGNTNSIVKKIERITRLLNKIDYSEQGSEYQQIHWVQEVMKAARGNKTNLVLNGENTDYGQTNDINKAVYNRRSIRKYADQEIPEEEIYNILYSGLWAPSGCNKQPVEYLFVKEKDDMRFCKNLAGEGGSFPVKAKFAVIILVDTRNYTLPIERHMVYLDAAACIQNILLMSYRYGVGTCWLFWNNRKAKKAKFCDRFNLDSWLLPVSMVCFGYPENVPIAPERKKLKSSIHFSSRSAFEKFMTQKM